MTILELTNQKCRQLPSVFTSIPLRLPNSPSNPKAQATACCLRLLLATQKNLFKDLLLQLYLTRAACIACSFQSHSWRS